MRCDLTWLALALALVSAPAVALAGEAVIYDIDGETFEGYRATPSDDSKGLVLIIHDWDGLTAYEQKRAEMLAVMGYDAFAVDIFGKGNRPVEIADKKKEAGKLYDDRARMRKLILGGLAEARKESGEKTVVMGYCFGGTATLELARSGGAEDVVGYTSFHGGLATPEDQTYPAGTPPILVAHGGADASVSMDDVAALSQELEKAGVPYEIEVYSGAPHGFTNFTSDKYQKRADKQSWDAFSDFLSMTLAD
ncbi:MAG: dienelactone hydrolase family protein [Methyloceanibacter sp.]|uniref:dienelactone hydrolase family protein n=1 Tax=Methyloceanibacter sp. TaxID=1965321 RepID=UPI003D6C7CBF